MYQIVLCSCPDEDIAHALASAVVKKRLAACVNIIPKIVSIYRWQDNIETDNEVMLFIKTESKQFETLSEYIKQHHPYDTPEIVALNIQQGDNNYLNWITESLK